MIQNPLSALTERQLQILRMRLTMTKGEIARELNISPSTVHDHFWHAVYALGLKKANSAFFLLGKFDTEDLPEEAYRNE